MSAQWERSLREAEKSISLALTKRLGSGHAQRMAAELISVCRSVRPGRSGRKRPALTQRLIKTHAATLRRASKVLIVHDVSALAEDLLLQAERIEQEPPRPRGSPIDDAVRWFVCLTALVFRQHKVKIAQTREGLADQIFSVLFEVMRYNIHEYGGRLPWLREAQKDWDSIDDASLEFDFSDSNLRTV